MKSIFRYPGGKSKPAIQKTILKYVPQDIKEYREPFVGGGGIFFAMPEVETRWINDLNKNLIEVYKALQERPEEFIKKCREIEPEKKRRTTCVNQAGWKGNLQCKT